MMLEVAGGIFANSLAILTDAAHLLSDVAGFAISLFAIWAASWEATPNQSFGFYRLEILGALVSIQLIWLLTGILVYEAVHRLFGPSQPVDGRLMFIVATLGLLINLAMAFLLGHDGHAHGHDHGHNHGHSNGHTHKDKHVHNHANCHSEHTEDIGDGHGHNRKHTSLMPEVFFPNSRMIL
jgi:zinc transporter 2